MLEINIVVAMDENGVIGYKNDLPEWRLRDDLKFFMNLTTNHAVICGSKTFKSYPKGPLPNRENIILSRNQNFIPELSNERTFVQNTPLAALNLVAEKGIEKAFIGGGAEVYAAYIEMGCIDNIYLTKVKGKFKGDTYFPRIDLSAWSSEILVIQDMNERNSHSFAISKYSRPNR